MIVVEQLCKSFSHGWGQRARTVHAVQGVSFVARDACIVGLLGANGAGKSTSLRIVSGMLTADSGRASVDGIDVGSQPVSALARLGVLTDSRGLYPRLTARENVRYFARLHGVPDGLSEERLALWAQELDMVSLLDRRTEGFSQGERMKTALARALIHDPPNLVLDEPTNGLDVLSTRALRQVLRRLRDEHGKCIVLATHIMQEVERLCDEVVVVSHGRTVAHGTVPELLARANERDFEQAFVKLAFGAQDAVVSGPGGEGHAR